MMKKLLLALWLIAGVARAEELDFAGLGELAVQKDGRKKPLDTVATETVQKITGKRVFKDGATGQKMSALDVLLSMWLQTRDWANTPVVLVSYQPLKAQLGLPADQKYFSFRQLDVPAFQAIIQRVADKSRGQQKPQLTRDEREAEAVYRRLQALIDAKGLESLALVPHPEQEKGAWVPVTAVKRYYGDAKQAEADKLVAALSAAYTARDRAKFAAAADEFRQFLRGLSPSVYPAATAMRREVHYNAFHAFRKALLLYVLAFVLVIATWAVRSRVGYGIGLAAFAAGVVVHGYGFWLRIMISGRPPITNMYESVVWVSFGAALFALVLEAIYRQRYYIAAVAPVSAVMLVLADQFPAVLDPSIGPLMPVLRDNFWLTVHVPTITLGYAAFAVAMAVGHVALGFYVFAPGSKDVIGRLENFVYRAMQIGVLFLAAGTILGGIWAHYAWGRFWGWDPKETWALIALLAYIIPLHGRLAGWMSNFALSVASVVCFLAVLMAWYGVNFVLGIGLHSYGFGVGGFGYVLGFVVLELALVSGAAWRRQVVR